MEYLDRENLKRISTWGKVVGITSIIMGVLSIIISLVFSPAGIVSGVISIITGYLFYQTGTEASGIISSDDFTAGNVNVLLNKYGKLLLIMGILTIISLIVLIPSIIFLITM
ncbi:DUF5362 family protein [Oceanobacillus sp. J11TS1]|uniref:DUF5362 family protein n=1 Tax=Oceanobacillus sp. J11TS1 TaxID=2807191 RepID=UPI001B1E7368|nr:DUF5362 family protein [Oceanobacillus sp. J11TS1]GIO23277.1 hypothetical protein J11TS1_18580 [Oceanobacillus sp. J11TS1]